MNGEKMAKQIEVPKPATDIKVKTMFEQPLYYQDWNNLVDAIEKLLANQNRIIKYLESLEGDNR